MEESLIFSVDYLLYLFVGGFFIFVTHKSETETDPKARSLRDSAGHVFK